MKEIKVGDIWDNFLIYYEDENFFYYWDIEKKLEDHVEKYPPSFILMNKYNGNVILNPKLISIKRISTGKIYNISKIEIGKWKLNIFLELSDWDIEITIPKWMSNFDIILNKSQNKEIGKEFQEVIKILRE